MKRKIAGKWLLLLLLLPLLLCGGAAHADAADSPAPNTPKEEVVYAILDAAGKLETVEVVNSFRLHEAGPILDYGAYDSALNLTSQQPIRMENGRISAEAEAGSFYYQGSMSQAQLPWLIDLRYQLDGQTVTAAELPGADGALTMDISIRHNPKGDAFFFENYALQLTVNLDGDKCRDISAPDATVASAGGMKTLSYIVFSNRETRLTWSARVSDFSMDGVQIAGIPLNFTLDDFDTSGFRDDIHKLQDGVVELDDGVYDLHDGVLTMRDELPELTDGVSELLDGVNELYDAIRELTDGAVELRDGAWEIEDGVSELHDSLPDLQDGAEELLDGVKQLRQGSAEFYHALLDQAAKKAEAEAAIQAAQEQVEAAMTAINDYTVAATVYGTLDGVARGAEQGAAAAQIQANELRIMADAARGQADQAQFAYANGLLDLDALTAAEFGAGQAEGAAQTAAGVAAEMQNSANTARAQANSALAALQAIGATPEQLQQTLADAIAAVGNAGGAYGAAETARQLAGGYALLDDGLDELNDSLPELADGVDELIDGVAELLDGVREFAEGHDEFSDGMIELYGELPELVDGVRELLDGVTELQDGVDELADGAGELKDGVGEMRDETSDMDSQIDEQIDELLAEYGGRDFEPKSFVSPDNTRILAVQFVCKSADIQAPEVEEIAAQEADGGTFWQRLSALGVYWQRFKDFIRNLF